MKHAALGFALIVGLSLCAIVPLLSGEPSREAWLHDREERSAAHGRVMAHAASVRVLQPSVSAVFSLLSVRLYSDSLGRLVVVGEVQNITGSILSFGKPRFSFYNTSGGLVGSDFTYAYGTQNSLLSGSEIYTDTLPPNATGFFKLWTNFQANPIASYSFTSDGSIYDVQPAASLAFTSAPQLSETSSGTRVSGSVKNNSATAATYFTKVAFAGYRNGSIYDVDFTYVNGSTATICGSTISTDTWIQPGATASFSNTFLVGGINSIGRSLIYWSGECATTPNPTPTPTPPPSASPFGSFDTPVTGSTLVGEAALTGWALDDQAVTAVEIYRNAVAGEGAGPNGVFVGNAVFVNGARPDIATTYSSYPNAARAGFGYMLLTNMLPNQGAGVFSLSAYAKDGAGNNTALGTKSISIANTTSAKPFGTLDTPGQGATISGTYTNFGWAVTPQPNAIAGDGLTIDIYIDNVLVGHPNYNNYRADIANLFPGLKNSTGAVGHFTFDTRTLANGVHTISWIVRDNVGNSQGIGSRYFTVQN